MCVEMSCLATCNDTDMDVVAPFVLIWYVYVRSVDHSRPGWRCGG